MTAARLTLRAAEAPPILWVAVLLLAVAVALLPGFFSPDNLANVARQSAVLALLAVGQTFVIVAGLMDLSVGMLATLVLVLAADLMDGRPDATLAAVALAVALGAGVGALTGVLNNLLRINSLILTLGTLTILQGVTFIYTDQSVGAPSPAIVWLANGDLFGLPPSLLLVLVATALAHVALHHTRFGVHLAAVGGAEQSARQAGIAVDRVVLAAFVISGLSAGLAGLLLLGRLGTGYPNAGVGLELDAIVAVVLGGTSLAGGRGSVIASVAAAVVLGIVSNMLNLLEVSSFVQMVIKGLVVIAVILAGQVRPETTR
jgi:ribose/xylose/arabinose/galactoside ABC-type transport system permease subunit